MLYKAMISEERLKEIANAQPVQEYDEISRNERRLVREEYVRLQKREVLVL